MTWKTDVNKVINDVGNTFNNVANTIQDTFGSIATRTINDVQSFFQNGSTVVGINVQQIPTMKEAIRTVNSMGLKAIYDGDGIVVKQLPPAGRPFPLSKILRIKLSSVINE